MYNIICDNFRVWFFITLSLANALVTNGYKHDIAYFFDINETEIKNPVKVEGILENRAETLHFNVKASYIIAADCARCAQLVEQSGETTVNIVLTAEKMDENSDDIIAVPDQQLDLDAFLTEMILLDMPSKLLCKEDCKGLCSICGQNLNEAQCGCKRVTSPFEVLKNIK